MRNRSFNKGDNISNISRYKILYSKLDEIYKILLQIIESNKDFQLGFF